MSNETRNIYDRLASIPINDLEFSERVINCLQRAGWYKTAADLDAASDDTLLRIPHFGRKCLKEVRSEIKRIRGNQLSITEEVMLWAAEHQVLVQALIRGEAVIVPENKETRQ